MRYTRAALALALALLSAGCQTPIPGVGAPAGGKAPAAVEPDKGPALPASPAKLANYEFKPISAQAAGQLATRAAGGAPAGTAAAPAPAMAPVPELAGGAKVAADAMVVRPGSPYAHGSYFSGPYGPMKLESASEAEGPGEAGGWSEIRTRVVAPVLADWAPDGRLISSSGTLGADGKPYVGEERWPGELGWRATYASASRNEVLEFHVTPKGTKITKLRWAPISLDLEGASVDAGAALATAAAAIKDAQAKSEEERLGHDYFFGKDQGGGEVVAMVAPAPGIAVGEPHPSAPAPEPILAKQVFELKPGGRWRVNLQAIADKVVWELSYDPGTYEAMQAEKGWSLDPSAYAMIDARTGTLVRLRRPTLYPMYTGEAQPMPRPVDVKPAS